MNTVTVKAHVRRKPSRPIDPFEAQIEARKIILAAKMKHWTKRQPSAAERLMENVRAIRRLLRKAVQ